MPKFGVSVAKFGSADYKGLTTFRGDPPDNRTEPQTLFLRELLCTGKDHLSRYFCNYKGIKDIADVGYSRDYSVSTRSR